MVLQVSRQQMPTLYLASLTFWLGSISIPARPFRP